MTRNIRIGALAGACIAAGFGVAADAAVAGSSTTAQVKGGTLQVTGSGGADTIALRLQPGVPGVLQVDVGADGTPDFSFDRSTFTAIAVDARSGRDTVTVDQSAGTFTDERVTIDGGGDDDVLRGGDGNDVLIGGGGNDTVTGGRGSDTATLGTGDDHFVWNPGDASDSVDGQGGADTLDFNGANANEAIALAADGARTRLTRDIGSVTMSLAGVETVAVDARGGADTITVGDATGTDLVRADIDLGTDGADDLLPDTVNVVGTAGADRVAVASSGGAVLASGLAATVAVTGSGSGDTVAVQTLGGADAVSTGVGLPGQGSVGVDGGEGTDTLTYNGTAAADSVAIVPNGAAAVLAASAGEPVQSTAVENVTALGAGGGDTISAANGLATLTHLTIDGGTEADTLRGGDGGDTIDAGSGDDVVIGGRGSDVVTLGAGNDTVVWDPGDGSDRVDGQTGSDTLAFNGANIAEAITMAADGSRARLTRDIGAVTMDLGGVEGIQITARGGADTVTVHDLTGTGVTNVGVDLAQPGGIGDTLADTVTVDGTAGADAVTVARTGAQVLVSGLAATTTITGSEPALDTLQVNTLAGSDTAVVAPDVSDLIIPVVDLGTGQ